jgi:hypothetical protein
MGYNSLWISGHKDGGGASKIMTLFFCFKTLTPHALLIGRTTVSRTGDRHGDRHGLNCREKCVLPSSYTAHTTHPLLAFVNALVVIIARCVVRFVSPLFLMYK